MMLWDKESIKLKFVSTATRGTAVALAQPLTPANATARKGQMAVHTCHQAPFVSNSSIDHHLLYLINQSKANTAKAGVHLRSFWRCPMVK